MFGDERCLLKAMPGGVIVTKPSPSTCTALDVVSFCSVDPMTPACCSGAVDGGGGGGFLSFVPRHKIN